MDIDPGWANLLWKIVAAFCTLCAGAVTMWARSHFITRAELVKTVADIRDSQSGAEQRLAKLEAEVRTAPKHNDLIALSHQISGLTGRVASMEGQTQRNNRLLEAIHDHLLNTKGHQ